MNEIKSEKPFKPNYTISHSELSEIREMEKVFQMNSNSFYSRLVTL